MGQKRLNIALKRKSMSIPLQCDFEQLPKYLFNRFKEKSLKSEREIFFRMDL
jgi:hypothetical protein